MTDDEREEWHAVYSEIYLDRLKLTIKLARRLGAGVALPGR